MLYAKPAALRCSRIYAVERVTKMSKMLRIGAFAKQFNVPASTIRYYIQRGILVPEVQNSQYLFSESCVQDMKQVLEFKEMQFSLEDIHALLTQKRKFNFAQENDAEPYLQLLYQQEDRLKQKLNEAGLRVLLLDQLKKEFIP